MSSTANRITISWLFVIFLVAAVGCVTLRTDVSTGGDLRSYKRAYIAALSDDEFQIYSALNSELADMGMQVFASPFTDSQETDLLVKYTYDGGWDMTRYLQSFQFQFINAKTNRIVATQSYKLRGFWFGVRDGRLEAAFNELRAKNGFPPTRQFSK